MRRRIVAVEGPCCAGKTTLSRGLLRTLTGLSLGQVPCYADQVGGGRHLPRPVPQTLDEDAQALRELLRIEHERTAAALSTDTDLVLLDRGVHTLLAQRHAIERLTGLACFGPARRVLAQAGLRSWPDLVLYLDVPQQHIHDRNNGKFTRTASSSTRSTTLGYAITSRPSRSSRNRQSHGSTPR